jgi:L-amino acid N-acyltransferase YncA
MVRPATQGGLSAILAIYNDAVLHSTAIWNDQVVDLESRRAWLLDRQSRNYPVLVAEDGGKIVGFSSFGDFRPFDGYRLTVEHSAYAADSARRNGFGRALFEALFKCGARKGPLDFRHRHLGFNRVGNKTILMGGMMHLIELFRTGLSVAAPRNLWP